MGYTSLPSNLNAIIGIKSYYCVILDIVILHDVMKTIQNRFVFFSKKRTKNKNRFLKKNGFKKTTKKHELFLLN